MPFFIDHYRDWVDEIIIIDGHSTDRSVEVALEHGKGKVHIRHDDRDTGEKMDDGVLKTLRNECWKEGADQFDWIIVCDNDEFLYHKDIHTKLKQYKEQGITMPTVEGYEMWDLNFPKPGIPITRQIRAGEPSKHYSKQIIFNPHKVVPNWGGGSHMCYPEGEVKTSEKDTLKLLHYCRLGYEYYVSKAKYMVTRQSEKNIEHKNGIHYNWIADGSYTLVAFFNELQKRVIKVV